MNGRTSRAKRILCLWLPNWPIQRILAEEPELLERPLVLVSKDPRRGLVIAAAGRAARTLGVQPTMRLAEAMGLGDLEVRCHEPSEDIEALCELAEQAQRFSPTVGLEPLDRRLWAGRWLHQPECLLLDISGLAKLFGGYQCLLSEIGQWLGQQRFFGCLAIAQSVGSAWALANYAFRQNHFSEGSPSAQNGQAITGQAITDSESRDVEPSQYRIPPSRWLYVELEQERQWMDRLPIASLRLEQSTVDTLHRLGVTRIGQLANLPRAGLASRLGRQLIRRWDQSQGLHEEPIVGLTNSPDWICTAEVEYPVERTDAIAALLYRTVSQLANRLERRGEGALRIVCRLDLVEHPPLVLQLNLFRPTCDPKHLERLMNHLLEQQLPGRMQAALWRLSVEATLTAPLVWRQADLFQTAQDASRREMAGLVDVLSARLGRKQVLRASVQRESQPELAYSLRPLTGVRNNGAMESAHARLRRSSAAKSAEPGREDPLRRPLQLYPKPMAIEVVGRRESAEKVHCTERLNVPKTKNIPSACLTSQPGKQGQTAAPWRIKTARGWYQVVDACGPERLESGWWKGPSCRRDYYRIVTHQGAWWWIYRDLRSGKWYLHGVFD